MEENNKPTSELENVASETTEEVTPVNDQEVIELPEVKVELPAENNTEVAKVKKATKKVSTKTEKIQIVDDSAPVELPQTKEAQETTPAPSVNVSASDSQVIGMVKPDKQKSPIAMLVLFSLLILFIIFMPTAISLFNQYFGTNLNVDSLNNPTKKVDTPVSDDKDKQEIKMYDLSEDTVIKIDKIDFGGFKKDSTDGYVIKFYIKNNGSQLYSFEKKLYLDFYDNTNTFIGRTYIENVKDITGGITNNYTLNINSAIYNGATKVELIQRTEDDYPAVTLEKNLLTCTNTTTSLVYTFNQESKLTAIKDMYTYTKDEDSVKYNSDLLTYKTKASNLDALEGVTAVLTENDNGFISTVAIDYQYADHSKLPTNTSYYAKDTLAKIISFEMNAKGYTCR